MGLQMGLPPATPIPLRTSGAVSSTSFSNLSPSQPAYSTLPILDYAGAFAGALSDEDFDTKKKGESQDGADESVLLKCWIQTKSTEELRRLREIFAHMDKEIFAFYETASSKFHKGQQQTFRYLLEKGKEFDVSMLNGGKEMAFKIDKITEVVVPQQWTIQTIEQGRRTILLHVQGTNQVLDISNHDICSPTSVKSTKSMLHHRKDMKKAWIDLLLKQKQTLTKHRFR